MSESLQQRLLGDHPAPQTLEQLLEIHMKILDKLSQAPAPARQTDQSESTAQLAAAMAEAQGKFTNPDRTKTATVKGESKDGKPYEYDYKYADLADILNVIRLPLSQAGVAIFQDCRFDQADSGGQAVVVTTIRHSSGEWIRSVLRYPAPVTKRGVQDLGSIFTYLRRYSLSGLVGIAPEEDDDGKQAVDAARQDRQEQKKASKSDKAEAGNMPTEEQMTDFWATWKELAAPRFASKDQATAWLKDLDPNPNKANLGKLRSIINRLKLLKPLDGQADQAGKNGQADKKPAKGKDPKPKLTPEEQRRQAIQSRWSILVADKFKGIAEKDLATATACWWAAEHYGWKRDPETEEQDGQIVPTRPKATLSAVEDIQRAVDGLKDLATDELEEMVRDYLGWTHDRMLELNAPAEGAQ